MTAYDLCLARNWEYDTDFARILELACAARGMTLLDISAANLAESLSLLSRREAAFSALLDRASESDSSYLPLVEIARDASARRFNPRELADIAYDKTFLHQALVEDGIPVPRTLFLPAYLAQPELPSLDLASLSVCFTAKPALGGGGDGVMTEISTLEQIQTARQLFPDQRYLLQEHVTPAVIGDLPAWFRIIYCLDEIFICYWDTTTHVYTPVNEMGGRVEGGHIEGGHIEGGYIEGGHIEGGHIEGGHIGPPQQFPPKSVEAALRDSPILRDSSILANLCEVTRRIARLCRLDIFSTEICLAEDGCLLVVDYVNDPIDLRLQSKAQDGVPDFIVERIAARIAETCLPKQK